MGTMLAIVFLALLGFAAADLLDTAIRGACNGDDNE